MASQTLLFVIVGRNEPLFEAEFVQKASAQQSDAVTRQNYFVMHSALDLVEKAAWTTSNMYLRVVDKVRLRCAPGGILLLIASHLILLVLLVFCR